MAILFVLVVAVVVVIVIVTVARPRPRLSASANDLYNDGNYYNDGEVCVDCVPESRSLLVGTPLVGRDSPDAPQPLEVSVRIVFS